MSEDRVKSNFNDILSNLRRKFELTDAKWMERKTCEVKFRTQVPVKNEDYNEGSDRWVEEFSCVTNTVWVNKISNTGPKVKFRKQYQCWPHPGKTVVQERLFDQRKCRAVMDVKLYSTGTDAPRKNKSSAKLGLNALVKVTFQHLHPVDTSRDYAFFVHHCKPQPEPPSVAVAPSSEKISELVAKVIKTAPAISQKAAERAQGVLTDHCIRTAPSTTTSKSTKAVPPLTDSSTQSQLIVNPSSDPSKGQVFYVHQVVFDSASQSFKEVMYVTGNGGPTQNPPQSQPDLVQVQLPNTVGEMAPDGQEQTIIQNLPLPIVLSITSCLCQEEYQREIFLSPRNFNPHPFEVQLARTQDLGPVLFPENGDENPSSNNRYNIITVGDGKITKGPPPSDDHPYRKVARKIKYLISKKYPDHEENHVDGDIFDALAQQGADVLTYTPQQLQNYRSEPIMKKNYAFAYKVIDKATGDDFSHQQVRNAKTTNGEYRVKLPDGRLQIVSYKADKDGYKADVRYEVDPDVQAPSSPIYPSSPLRQYARGRPKTVINYVSDEEERQQQWRQQQQQQLQQPLASPKVLVLEQSGGPTQIPLNYVDVTTARPAYGRRRYPKVHAFSDRERHVPTAPSYAREPVVRYTSTPVPPVSGRYELFVPSSTYAPPIRAPPGHKNVIDTIGPTSGPGDALRHTLEQENDLPEGIYIVGKSGKR